MRTGDPLDSRQPVDPLVLLRLCSGVTLHEEEKDLQVVKWNRGRQCVITVGFSHSPRKSW
jgi:hypothetical protein